MACSSEWSRVGLHGSTLWERHTRKSGQGKQLPAGESHSRGSLGHVVRLHALPFAPRATGHNQHRCVGKSSRAERRQRSEHSESGFRARRTLERGSTAPARPPMWHASRIHAVRVRQSVRLRPAPLRQGAPDLASALGLRRTGLAPQNHCLPDKAVIGRRMTPVTRQKREDWDGTAPTARATFASGVVGHTRSTFS